MTATGGAGVEHVSPAARTGGVVVAIVAGITLATRLYLRAQQSDGILEAVSYMSQYFTILTNTITFLMMIWIAAGRYMSPRLIKAISIAIVLVGLIYHTLLAHLVSLSGLELWADHGTHTFVPILTGLWWLFLAPKPAFHWWEVPTWLAWPIAYCAYILIRASFSGFYPYPFLNLPELGWNGLLVSVAGMLGLFAVVGLVMTWMERFARLAT